MTRIRSFLIGADSQTAAAEWGQTVLLLLLWWVLY